MAVALAAAIGVVNFELSTFCTTDPPAMPTFTAQDYFNALGGGGALAQIAAIDKFRDALGNLMWPTLCKCDTVGTPAPPTLAPPPANLPTYQPPQFPTAPSSSPCWDRSASVNYVVNGQDLWWQPTLFPAAARFSSFWTGSQAPIALPVPLPNSIRFSGSIDSNGSATGAQANINFYSATGSIGGGGVGPVVGVGATSSITVPVPATAVYANVGMFPNGPFASAGQTAHGELQIFCAGSSATGISAPCCPPDPALQAELQALRSLVELIYDSLPAQLNSYADATVHAGLTGNGTVTLVGPRTLAIRVDITAEPTNLGVDFGHPDFLFDRGYVVPVVNAAPIRAESRLVYNPQMFILPALTEQIGYSLHPGVTISITELIRGP